MSNGSDAALRSALGLAMKAGRLRSGELAAEKALRSGKAALAVLDEQASENTRKHWSDMCRRFGVPLIFVREPGRAIGREAHMTAVVTDGGFARMILNNYGKDPEFGG